MKSVSTIIFGSPILILVVPNAVFRQRGASLPACKLSVFIFALLCVFTAGAQAHHASDGYLSLIVDGRSVTGQWDVALLDLERVIGLDADGDGNITRSEVDAKRAEIERYGLSRLRLEVDGTENPLKITGLLVDTFSDRTSGTPSPCYQAGILAESSATSRCSGNGRRAEVELLASCE